MRDRWLRTAIILLAVLVVHFPAHYAPWSTAPTREPLPEDGPAFVGNQSLAPREDESLVAAVVRASSDPASAWDGAADCVGRARWRPVSTALLVAERAVPWADTSDGAAAGAAIVSLLLHMFVALGAARLASALGGDRRAALLAGLLAAVSPAALSCAAWPARQAAVLATALALGGTLVALRGGIVRLLAAGTILALAGLAHELAFGWVLAVPLLRRAATAGEGPLLAAWPLALVPAAAGVLRWSVLGGLGGVAETVRDGALLRPNWVDGLTGIVRAFVAFALPSSSHFADGPFVFPFLVHLGALAVLVAGVALLVRRLDRGAAAAAFGAVVALLPVPIALTFGSVRGAPYQDAYLYLVLPLVAAATGLALARTAARGGALRIAAAACGAMLLGASVAATVTRAPAFRTKKAFIALARTEMPQSLVVRMWDVADRAGAGPSAIAAVSGDVRELARDSTGPAASRVRGDPVAAATISRFLTDYASVLRSSRLPSTHSAFDAGDAAAAAAAELRPDSSRTWAALARFRQRTGALRGAYAAANRAVTLAPDELGIIQMGGEIALAVGDPRLAADAMERALAGLSGDAASTGASPEFLLQYARALAADGALRVPDPASERGLRYRYDIAAEVLHSLAKPPAEPTLEVRQLLYQVYVLYGDFLASTDHPAMALVAYDRAVEQTGGNPNPAQAAVEHRKWLRDRLVEEGKAAEADLEAANRGEGTVNVADALVEVYIAFCRRNSRKDAEEVFAELARSLNGIPPELRLQRAVQFYAVLEDSENQATAEKELRQVLREKPQLARARYELARVLEWQGTLPLLDEARIQYAEAARQGSLEEWSLDAAARADALARLLAQQSR